MLKDVNFISMEGRKNFTIGNFAVKEDIPLPVYVDDNKKISHEDINPENIIKGMIKVLTDDPDNDYLEYYREFIFAVKPDIAESLSKVALEAERNEHFEDAIEIFKVLYILSNQSRDNLLNLAICYDEYSQYLSEKGIESESDKNEEYAYQFYKEIDLFDDKNENELFYLGRFFLIKENYDKAVECFQDFVDITDDIERKKEVTGLLNDIFNGGYNDDDYNTALEFIQSDMDNQSFEFIDKFIKRFPKSWHGYFLKGLALRKTGKYEEAIVNLETALKYNMDSNDINNEIGLCYTDLKIFHKAQMYFYNALKNNAEDANVLYNLAVLSFKKGDKNEALKYCQIILEFNPKDLNTKKLKEVIENI